jgi:hypothetical protein
MMLYPLLSIFFIYSRREIHAQNAVLQKNLAFKDFLVNGYKTGQVKMHLF